MANKNIALPKKVRKHTYNKSSPIPYLRKELRQLCYDGSIDERDLWCQGFLKGYEYALRLVDIHERLEGVRNGNDLFRLHVAALGRHCHRSDSDASYRKESKMSRYDNASILIKGLTNRMHRVISRVNPNRWHEIMEKLHILQGWRREAIQGMRKR